MNQPKRSPYNSARSGGLGNRLVGPSSTPRINQTRGERTISPHRRHRGRRLALIIFLIILLSGGVFGYKILAAGNKISTADTTLLGQLKDLIFNSGEFLAGEQDGRINIMLLAIGGEGHSGQNLADTIMIASIRPETGDVALLSIPRDLYVQVPGEEYFSKLNAVHAYGESQKTGQGPQLLQEKVEEITGLPIHYYARIDFTAFKHIVDAVGGVNITNDNTFYDFWHKINFPAGTEKMNGERALAFARARYVEGPEGGDFKRAQRQQQLLIALREKIFSVNTAFDFTAVNGIINSLADNIRTDLQIWEMKRFFEIARLINPESIHSVILTTGPNGVLVGSTEILGGSPASILKTRSGDFSEIQAIAGNIFTTEAAPTSSAQAPETIDPSPEPSDTPEETTGEVDLSSATIEVRNGTPVSGLAGRTQANLKKAGYAVPTAGNAANQTTSETTVYVLNATKSDVGQALAQLLSAPAKTDPPEAEAASSADILLILGQDAAS